MKLYHPGLDRTIDRTDRQAAVLAASGWEPVDDDGQVQEPPRSGKGSGVTAWREFAARPDVNLDVPADASREEIIAAWDASRA